MPDLIRGRTFNVPNVVLIGVAAVGIWFFFLRQKGPAAPLGTRGAVTPTGQATTDYSLGYAQGIQAAPQPPPAAPQGPPAPTLPPGSFKAGATGQTVWSGHLYRWAVTGPNQGPEVAVSTMKLSGRVSDQIGRLVYFNPNIPSDSLGDRVWFLGLTDGGFELPAWGTAPWPPPYLGPVPQDALATNTGTGVGGPAARKFHSGSRSSHEWHDAHPLVGARVLYPHYVRAVGGPARHVHEVHRVARQAGIHPARVLMLNPQHTGRIRIA